MVSLGSVTDVGFAILGGVLSPRYRTSVRLDVGRLPTQRDNSDRVRNPLAVAIQMQAIAPRSATARVGVCQTAYSAHRRDGAAARALTLTDGATVGRERFTGIAGRAVHGAGRRGV